MDGVSLILGAFVGFIAWFLVRYLAGGLYTVDQNERAVKTIFGKAERLANATTLDDPTLAETLHPEERERYAYPQVRVIQPGGPYFRWPWERVYKVSIATQTVNMAYDPESRDANHNNTMLDSVTKDQLNTGLKGQIRFRVSERNLYAFLFGVKQPITHVMGYFISIIRQRIANFEATSRESVAGPQPTSDNSPTAGVSINDLRKNLRAINEFMDQECASSSARYGVLLDASLITEIIPSDDIESALAAVNTAQNQVSSDISLAHAGADQRIVQSRRAVEIETLKAQAEVEPLRALAAQLAELKKSGPEVLDAYVRNVRLQLYQNANQVFLEVDQ
jgi:regulator of protease activity HflC (stomatin/prohibitin superfamily)